MRKSITLIMCSVMCISLMAGCSKKAKEEETTTNTQSTVNSTALEVTNYIDNQSTIDENLKAEADNGHTLDKPQIIVNPYGTAPLSAVIIFSTEEEVGGTVTVKGKKSKDNIKGSFEAAKNHIVPVYGLYNNATTKVEIKLENGTKSTVEIQTEDGLGGIDLGSIKAKMIDDSAYDYSQLTLVCTSMGAVYALDSSGDIRWFYNNGSALGVKQLKNGHLILPSSYTLMPFYYKSGVVEIDFTGKVYNEFAVPGGMHHDIFEMENGNFLIASEEADLSSVEDGIVEIDRTTGEVVWELDMRDLLDTEDGKSASIISDGSEEVDWFHNNGVWYDKATDTILLSARHVDAIVGVNKTTKKLSWILGDPTGWKETDKSLFFTPKGNNFEWQYAQHNVTVLDNGDIMLFDNGTAKVKYDENNARVKGDNIYSRAVVYRINTEDMTVEQVWEYGKDRGPSWYSDWISGSVSLDGTTDKVWITAGSNLYNPAEKSYDYGSSGMFIPGLIKTSHLDYVVNNKLAYEITISGESYFPLVYRSFRVSMYTDNGDLDVNYKGAFLGNLGIIASADTTFTSDEIKDAKSDVPCTWALDRTKLTMTGSYSVEDDTELTDSYVVLVGSDGSQYTVKARQDKVDNKDAPTTVNVNAWVSTASLDSIKYDIYVSLGGTLYNSGYVLDNTVSQ